MRYYQSFRSVIPLDRVRSDVLLTRSPLVSALRPATVRLACVRHAASVQSEPGSNSSVRSRLLGLGFLAEIPQACSTHGFPAFSSPSNAHAYRLCFVKDHPRSPPATISQARYFSTAFLRKPALLLLFFQIPPPRPFPGTRSRAGSGCTQLLARGGDCSMACAQAGEDRPAHPENSAAMRRHRRLQGIDEQARNVAPRLFVSPESRSGW